jgi:hypothetical protein
MFKRGLLIVGILFCLDLIGSNNSQSCSNLGGVNITGINFTEFVRFLRNFHCADHPDYQFFIHPLVPRHLVQIQHNAIHIRWNS